MYKEQNGKREMDSDVCTYVILSIGNIYIMKERKKAREGLGIHATKYIEFCYAKKRKNFHLQQSLSPRRPLPPFQKKGFDDKKESKKKETNLKAAEIFSLFVIYIQPGVNMKKKKKVMVFLNHEGVFFFFSGGFFAF